MQVREICVGERVRFEGKVWSVEQSNGHTLKLERVERINSDAPLEPPLFRAFQVYATRDVVAPVTEDNDADDHA